MTEDEKRSFRSHLSKEGMPYLEIRKKKGTIIRVGKTGRSESRTLEEVYHMEGLKYNLVSMSQLCDESNKVTFTSIDCRVKKLDAKEIVLATKRHKSVYKTDIIGMLDTYLKCLDAIVNDLLRWHK